MQPAGPARTALPCLWAWAWRPRPARMGVGLPSLGGGIVTCSRAQREKGGRFVIYCMHTATSAPPLPAPWLVQVLGVDFLVGQDLRSAAAQGVAQPGGGLQLVAYTTRSPFASGVLRSQASCSGCSSSQKAHHVQRISTQCLMRIWPPRTAPLHGATLGLPTPCTARSAARWHSCHSGGGGCVRARRPKGPPTHPPTHAPHTPPSSHQDLAA